MSKELEALERIRKNLARHYGIEKIYEWSDIEDDFDIIKKQLKALEIIKEKNVDVRALKIFQTQDSYNHYCRGTPSQQLTQEKYDLLKEVLL